MNRDVDYDELNMNVILSDPFFKVGWDDITYIQHTPQSRSSMFNFECFDNLKMKQKVKVHQTMKNINFLLINGELTETFKKEIFPKPDNAWVTTKNTKKSESISKLKTINYEYKFPKGKNDSPPNFIHENGGNSSISEESENADKSSIEEEENKKISKTNFKWQKEEIEEMMKNKYSVFNALSKNSF